jgi:hypothetical protein
MKNMNDEKHIKEQRITFKELSEGLHKDGRFAYLQIILSKNTNRQLNQMYLMVTHSNLWSDFRIIRLNDLEYKKEKILLKITDLYSGKKETVSIEIRHPELCNVLLICLEDVLKMNREINEN